MPAHRLAVMVGSSETNPGWIKRTCERLIWGDAGSRL